MTARLDHKLSDGVGSPFAQLSTVDIDSAHPRVCGEGNEMGFVLGDFAAAQVVLLLCQDDDGAALWRLICQTRQLGGICKFVRCYALDRNEFDGLAIPQRDGPGLVQQAAC